MNKWFKRAVITFMVVTLVFFPIAYVIPKQVRVERTVTINAAPEHVFAYLNDPHQFEKWEPWNKDEDPTITHKYAGAESGVGAERSWESKKWGLGKQVITASEANKHVAQDLYFQNEEKPAKSAVTLTPKEGGTEVKWTTELDMGYNPFMRYCGLMMDSWLGSDMEKGLAKLKDVVEKDVKAKPVEEKPTEDEPVEEQKGE